MLPQTRQKLRIFSLVCLLGGCLLLFLIWISSKPEIMVKGTKTPTFWDVILSRSNVYDEVQWKMMDLTVSYEFFSDLLRFIMMATVFMSALAIVVVINDVRLTKK